MENLNNVPSTGTFGNSVQKINSNFDLIVNAINSLEYQTTRSKGILNYGQNPATVFPNAVAGDWCMILSQGNVFPATIKTYNGSTWSGSGTWNPDGVDLTGYAKTTDMTTAIANSLSQATARMGYGECTVNGTALTVSIPNFILPTSGGTVHIKMSAVGTGASTLSINGTTPKTLWYNGKAVSSTNTWEAGEIISVFYDGTKYMSSNSQGVGGKLKVDDNNNADLSIGDSHGSDIVEFKDGHIRTKHFDSRDSKTKVGNKDAVDLSICDENDNDIVEFKGGHIRTKYFNSQDLIIDKTYSYKGEKISLGDNYLTVQEMMSTTHTIPRYLQGCAVYGKYLFVADDYLNSIAVYDLEDKVLVNAVSFTPNSNYHCNNANFGTYKYANTDATPCMYISQEKEDTHLILVFQVTFSNDVFGFNLVQTITMPTPQAGVSPYYPNSMIDADNGILYVMGYSTNSYTESDSNKIIVLKYELPLPTDGDVTLQPTDIYAKFPSITATQGGCIYKGKFYQAFGTASTGSVVIRSSDMQNFCNRLYLADYGVTTEPEAACIYDDCLLVIGIDKKVYKFKF